MVSNHDLDITAYVDSIIVDPSGYTSKDFKKKNNKEFVILRKQGSKFKFSSNEGKPDMLQQVVLLIFLDNKGPSGTSLNSTAYTSQPIFYPIYKSHYCHK